MSKYVVVLEKQWDTGVDPVICLASFDSLDDAKNAHLLIKEGEGTPCQRNTLTPTGCKITIAIEDSYGKHRKETAIICKEE